MLRKKISVFCDFFGLPGNRILRKSIVIVEEKNKAHFFEEMVERSVNYFFKGCEHEN